MYDYRYLEENLTKLVALVGSKLSKDELEDVTSYVNAGEYGVAFQYLCEILGQAKQPIPPESYILIESVGLRMSLDPKLWKDLGGLVERRSSV